VPLTQECCQCSDIPTWAGNTGILAGWNQSFHISSRTLHNTRVIEWFIWLRSKVIAAFTRSGHVPTLIFTDTASVQILKATTKMYKLLMPEKKQECFTTYTSWVSQRTAGWH